MTEEEYFRKYYPDFCYGDKPLSPCWDFFQEGVEFGERQSEEKIEELEKENAELKEKGDKWFVFETDAGNWGMDKATQYTVDRHNYFYGTKEECQKWAVEYKIKDYTGHKYCYDRLDDQLTKAKEIIKGLLQSLYCWEVDVEFDVIDNSRIEQAEQFLKEIEK